MELSKQCAVCGQVKPYAEFYHNSTYTDGYEGKCKECRKAYQQQWRADNRKQHRTYSKTYHRNHREERAAYYHGWLAKNADKVKRAIKRWRARNSERMLAMRKAQNARRRALLENAKGDYTPAEWLALKELYGNRCLQCGVTGAEAKITPDHIVPLSLGGSNITDNLQPLCWSCNAAKGARIADYRTYVNSGIGSACVTPSAKGHME